MTTISKRLRFRATVKADSDIAAGRKAPTYGKETELDWQAADTIDALVAALLKAKYWYHSETPNDVRKQVNAALALARGSK